MYLVLFAYRTSKHTSTGIAPFQLMFGRDSPRISHVSASSEYDPSSYERFLGRKILEIQEFVEGN